VNSVWRQTQRWWQCLFLLLPLLAGVPAPLAQTIEDGAAALHVYVREGCPHCTEAKAWLAQRQAQDPALQLVFHQVDSDAAAREALVRITESAGLWPPGVPTFVFGNRVLVGFGGAEASGPLVEGLLTGATPATPGAEPAAALGNASTGSFGILSVSELGLPLFTVLLGLVDGFNPCAMWVLLFLLSLLVHLHDRRRMALIAGTFVLASGVIYYAFMAAWLNLFLAVGMSRLVWMALAVLALCIAAVNLKDALFGLRGVSLSIPAQAKPGLYARMRGITQQQALPLSLLGVALLAVVVNFIELLCTAGLPALYTAILSQQGLTPAAHYGYLGLYILGYVADDSLMVGTAVFALSHSKLSENTGRLLKLLSGLVMAGLGLVILLRPEWLQ